MGVGYLTGQGGGGVDLDIVEKKIVPEYLPISQITRSGSTATASINYHNLIIGSNIEIFGANQPEYNGEHTILSVPNASQITFSIANTAVTPATGIIYGLKKSGYSIAKGDKLMPFMGGVAPCGESFGFSPITNYKFQQRNQLTITGDSGYLTNQNNMTCHLRENIFVNIDVRSSDYKIIVNIIEYSNNAIKLLSSTVVNISVSSTPRPMAMEKHDDNTILLCYTSSASQLNIVDLVFSESLVLTVGTPFIVNIKAGYDLAIEKINANQFVMGYCIYDSDYILECIGINYSSGTFTKGSKYSAQSSTSTVVNFKIHKVSDTKVGILFYDGSPNRFAILNIINNVFTNYASISGVFTYKFLLDDFLVVNETTFVCFSATNNDYYIQLIKDNNGMLFFPNNKKSIEQDGYAFYGISGFTQNSNMFTILVDSSGGATTSLVRQFFANHFKIIDNTPYLVGSDLLISAPGQTQIYGKYGMFTGDDIAICSNVDGDYSTQLCAFDKNKKADFIAKSTGNIGDTIKVYKI